MSVWEFSVCSDAVRYGMMIAEARFHLLQIPLHDWQSMYHKQLVDGLYETQDDIALWYTSVLP